MWSRSLVAAASAGSFRARLPVTALATAAAAAGRSSVFARSLATASSLYPTATSNEKGSFLPDGNQVVTLIPGDGIGPEISESVKKIFAADK
ncbi:hypothetical protein HK405_012200, partial [Cladochytrium tenue]